MKANQFRIGNTVKYNGKAYKLYGIAEEYPFWNTIIFCSRDSEYLFRIDWRRINY